MIRFFMPFNNLSGSCVALKKLSNLLNKNSIANKIYSPDGFFEFDAFVPEIRLNPFSHLRFFYSAIRNTKKSDVLIFNTFVCVFPAFFSSFFRRSYLYLHEDISKNIYILFLVRFALYMSPMRLLVVNPELASLFKSKESITLSNFYDEARFDFSKPYDIDFLMISNALKFKGVLDFIELAKRYPDKKFLLLTNKFEFYQGLDIPSNLELSINQDLKDSFLLRSRFIVNLSKANETFGLSTFEGVCSGLFPITFENSGSKFMLGENYPFLRSIDDFEIVYSRILIESNCFSKDLEYRMSSMFCSKIVLERLKLL